MSSPVLTVSSAAVIGGELIIGLNDGSIINCGNVQGPQGLKGDSGPIGATGQAGVDGNTIHSTQGTPEYSLGRSGDFAINTALWEIYGPKTASGWGTGTPLRGNRRNGQGPTNEIFGNNPSAPANPNAGTMQTTRTLPLVNPSTRTAKNLPDSSGLQTQEDYNNYVYDALEALSNGVSPDADLNLPYSLDLGTISSDLRPMLPDADPQEAEAREAQELELITLSDSKGKDLGDVAFECANGIGVRLSTLYENTIRISGENLQREFRDAEADLQEQIDDLKDADVDLSGYATKSDLSTATQALPYRLETDKTVRDQSLPPKTTKSADPIIVHAGGEIQLVDNLGFFHNVTFTGKNGIETSSTAAGIEISAPDLKSRIETLEEQIQTLASLIPPVDIGNVSITSTADQQDGNAAARKDEMFVMTANNSGETQHGLRYSWSIKRGAGRISGPTNQQMCSAWCTDPAPSTVEFQCVVSHPATEETQIGSKIVLVAE